MANFTQEQKDIMEWEFQRFLPIFPNTCTLEALAQNLDLPKDRVKYWFDLRYRDNYRKRKQVIMCPEGIQPAKSPNREVSEVGGDLIDKNKQAFVIRNHEAERVFVVRGTLLLDVPTLVSLKEGHHPWGHVKTITSPNVTNIGDLKWELKLHKAKSGDNYLLTVNCIDKGIEHFWFAKGKFALYSKEGNDEKRYICSLKYQFYAFYGNNVLPIASTIQPGKWPISLSVELRLLRVKPKYLFYCIE